MSTRQDNAHVHRVAHCPNCRARIFVVPGLWGWFGRCVLDDRPSRDGTIRLTNFGGEVVMNPAEARNAGEELYRLHSETCATSYGRKP